MLAAPAAFARHEPSGARPINLNKDSEQILDLLDQAFGPLPSGRGQRMLISPSGIEFGPFLGSRRSRTVPGFVWVESGRIVGTLSLLPVQRSDKYLVANVAVRQEYRRRGIATELMKTAIDYIRHRGGREISLQVDRDNDAANRLYDNLDFQSLGDVNLWTSTTASLRPIDMQASTGIRIRSLSRGDERTAYDLDLRCMPSNLRWPAPPRRSLYSQGYWRKMVDFFNGRKFAGWIAEAMENESGSLQPVGIAYIDSEWARPHEIALRVADEWRDLVDRQIVSRVLEYAKSNRPGQLRINHMADDDLVSELLRESNFRLKRCLRIMRCVIDE